MRSGPVLVVLLLFLGMGTRGGTRPQTAVTRAWAVMGTLLEVTVVGPDSASSEAAARAAYREVVLVDSLMSLYRPESELTRLNARAGWGPMAVSQPLWSVISAALDWGRRSGGAFDITVGPLVRLWGFLDGGGPLPDSSEVEALLPLVGSERVELEAEGRRVCLPGSGMIIDLGGIAKGYAVDRAVGALQARGVRAGLINLGGNIGVVGVPPGEGAWSVGITHPREEAGLLGTVRLTRGAIATSGDYERFFVADGVRYSHILDPRTGWPVSERVSVTVWAPTGLAADALSTALFVLGGEEGEALLREEGGEAVWVWSVGEGLEAVASDGWEWITGPCVNQGCPP